MKFIKFLLILFISINSPIKADSNQSLINELKKGGKLIFIRHAYAPGGGDPNNFDINDCKTQRNLSNRGREQARKIGTFFKDNNILIDKVYSSEWCRCKETASIAFNRFETKNFLNSFFSTQFAKNKDPQMKNMENFIKNSNKNKNLVFVTHYVVISESLNYASSSGEIVISNKDFKVIDTIEIEY
jgi:broad specificity phosphatase PhoE|tara:strand:- start:31 stop:588 length:558 start_codon:yes stop_codon:yes gene_type:complete